MSTKFKKEEKIAKIAYERIEILLNLADKIYKNEPKLAQRYGELARKIAMKARIRMPEQWRIRFCNKCKKFLYPGLTSHVRIKAGKPSKVIYYCDMCKNGFKTKILH